MDYQQMCPKYEKAIDILGKRWTGLILRVLMGGPHRFSEITRIVGGLSDRLLSQRLQELEEAGIVKRQVIDERPIAVEYTLTEKGLALRGVIEAIQAWADVWEAVEVEVEA